MIKCKICDDIIQKYEMDCANEIMLTLKDDKLVYICDTCSYNIALQRIARKR